MEKEKLGTGISTDRKARERKKKEMSVSLDKETCLGKKARESEILTYVPATESRREKDETEWWKMTKQSRVWVKQRRGEKGGQRVAEHRPYHGGGGSIAILVRHARRVGIPTRRLHHEPGKDSLSRGRTDKDKRGVGVSIEEDGSCLTRERGKMVGDRWLDRKKRDREWKEGVRETIERGEGSVRFVGEL